MTRKATREEAHVLFDQLTPEQQSDFITFMKAMMEDDTETLDRYCMRRFGLTFAEFMAKEKTGQSDCNTSPGNA